MLQMHVCMCMCVCVCVCADRLLEEYLAIEGTVPKTPPCTPRPPEKCQ